MPVRPELMIDLAQVVQATKMTLSVPQAVASGPTTPRSLDVEVKRKRQIIHVRSRSASRCHNHVLMQLRSLGHARRQDVYAGFSVATAQKL